MAYHINDKGEVKRCQATKRACKFGGTDGKQNHFASEAEAEAALQARYQSTVNKGLRKTSGRGQALAALEHSGVTVGSVKRIASHSFGNPGSVNTSSVELLEEKPDEGLLKSIRSQRLRAFNN